MERSDIISTSNNHKNKYHKKALKSILENLRQKYSLKQIIDCLIFETTTKKENYKYIKNNELNNIISLICSDIGTLDVFKCILDIQGDEQDNNIEESIKIDKGKEEEKNKRFSLSSTFEEELIEINDNNNNNIINIDDDEEEEYNNIIHLTDSEDSDNMEKIIIPYGYKSTAHINNEDRKLISKKRLNINSHQNKSVEKMINFKKLLNKFKLKDLSFHCSLINGYYYKYRLKLINLSKGIAKFICLNPKCESYGIYNLNTKMFTLIKEHNINKNCSCLKIMDSKDKIYYSFMKNNNIEEMQIIND